MSDVMETTETTTYVTVEVNASHLRDVLRAGLVSASKDRMIPVLCAVKLTACADGSIVVESTDRFRLTEATAPKHRQADASGDEWSIIIDRADADRLVKLIPATVSRGGIDYATVTYSAGVMPSITVQVNYGSSLTAHGIDGQFPRTSSLWPDVDAPRDGVTEIGFDPAYLGDVAKLPWPKGCHHAGMFLTSPSKPAVFAHEGDTGEVSFRHLLMPRRRVS